MPCPHCGEKINICPNCDYGIDEEDNFLEEFFVCPKCGEEIKSCPRCGKTLQYPNRNIDKKSVYIQKKIGYTALILILLGIIYLIYYDNIIGF